MSKYLKLFNTTTEFEQFKNGEDYVTPNVSYVEEIKGVSYEAKKSFKLRAKYNATPDNLVAFTDASNIKSLKVNGTPIKIEPIKNEINNFDVLGENISIDLDTGLATFPESYLIKSPVSSWSFKAKDPNYVINENTYICMLGMMDGMTLAQPMSPEEMSYAFTTNDGVTIEVVDEFMTEMNMQIQSGLQIGFTLLDVDMNSQTFVFIDTEHQTNVTSGGLPTYSFDSEGLYDVEIELADPVMSMYFIETPLISIEIGDGITSIGSSAFYKCSGLTHVTIGSDVTTIGSAVFSNCSSMNEIICKGNISPQIQNDTFGSNYNGVKKFGVLKVPDNADYSSWMSTDEYYLGYHGWTCSNIPVYDLICTYKVDNISSDTKLYVSTADFKPVMMVINDEKLDAASYYKFNEIGQYEVIYRFLTPITEIKAETFSGCSSLTSITIPDSVTSIGKSALSSCKGLTTITIPDSVTTIGDYAFSACSGLTEITIPDSVTSIGKDAFRFCKGLTEITIPDSVTTIGDYAFSECTGLTEATIGSTTIGNEAFYKCSGLTSIIIGLGVTTIGNEAFYYCTGLNSIVISPGNTVYDSRENCNCIIETATNALVQGCKNSFIPDSVTTIGYGAFWECTGLTSINIPDSVTKIENSAFLKCTGLTSINIPDSVTEIENNAFSGCSGLTEITIGSGVTTIGAYAFSNCSSMDEIICKGNIAPQIKISTFGAYHSPIKKFGVLKVPDNADYSSWMSTDEYYLGYYGWIYSNIPVYDLVCTYNVDNISSDTKLYQSYNTDFKPFMMIINGEKLDPSYCHKFNEIGQYEVIYRFLTPITEIKERAFCDCTNLTSITFPYSVTSIGKEAFRVCSGLTSIVIPYSVTTIGDYAFAACSGLTEITIPDSITTISYNAFAGCKGLTEITIPDSITTIDHGAFAGCKGLTSITCLAPTAPQTKYSTFESINTGGTLYVPAGSDYSWWMNNNEYYLGYYNWTIQYI